MKPGGCGICLLAMSASYCSDADPAPVCVTCHWVPSSPGDVPLPGAVVDVAVGSAELLTCGSRCRRTTHYVRGRCRAGGICADLFRTGWIVSRSSDLTAYNAYSYSSSHPSAGRRSRNTRHTLGRAQDQPVCLLTLLQGFRGAAAAGRLLAALRSAGGVVTMSANCACRRSRRCHSAGSSSEPR